MISYAGSHPLSIFFDSEDTAQLEQVIEFLEKTTAKTYNTSKGLYDYIGNELIRRVHFMLLCHDRSKTQATSKETESQSIKNSEESEDSKAAIQGKQSKAKDFKDSIKSFFCHNRIMHLRKEFKE